MAAGRVVRCVSVVLAVALGSAAAVTADDDLQKQREEALLRLRIAQLQLQQKQGKAKAKAPAKPLPPTVTVLPRGAIARLGDSRLRHAANPTCVAFSTDGKRVFTGAEDGVLRVWDVATGELRTTLQAPTGQATLAPAADGRTLAVSHLDGRIRLLNPDTLREAGNAPYALGGDFVLSADGSFFAGFNGSGFLTVFETATELPRVELPPDKPFAFHPDGKSIAAADKTGKVTRYMLAGGKPLAVFDHGAPVTGLAFSPGGRWLATGDGKVVKVWDLAGGKDAKPAAVIADGGRPKAWVTDDRLAAGDGFAAGAYDLKEKAWVGRVKGVTGAWAVSPDGTKLAATGTGLRVRIWNLITGEQLHAENDTFPDAALLLPTPDGKGVFVLSGEFAYLWRIDQPTATPAGRIRLGKAITAATGKDRLAVVIASAVLVYDDFDPTRPLPEKPSRAIKEHSTGCKALAVSADGKKVAYSGTEMKTVVADAATGDVIRVIPVQTLGLALAFSPDGKTLAMVGRDGFAKLFATEQPAAGPADANLWSVRVQRGQKGTAAFSPDGKRLAVSSSGLFKVLNAADGSEEFSAGGIYENGLFQQVTFTPDGRFVVAATEGSSGGVFVWDATTGELARRFSTGFGTVLRVSVFPCGTKAVSAGAEEVITVWDLTVEPGKP